LAITTSALRDATALGFDRSGIVETIVSIERQMFFKSMTTFADHRIWQDVYHVPARGLMLYLKFQADVVTEFAVMSFKEK
jgi:motility quorum-sensing regulator/GCU-specific mRNA interferase toxin